MTTALVKIKCSEHSDLDYVPNTVGQLVCVCNANKQFPRCNACGFIPDGQVFFGTQLEWDTFDTHKCR